MLDIYYIYPLKYVTDRKGECLNMLEFDYYGRHYEISLSNDELKDVVEEYYYRGVINSVIKNAIRFKLKVDSYTLKSIVKDTIDNLLEEILDNSYFRRFEEYIKETQLIDNQDFLDYLVAYYEGDEDL